MALWRPTRGDRRRACPTGRQGQVHAIERGVVDPHLGDQPRLRGCSMWNACAAFVRAVEDPRPAAGGEARPGGILRVDDGQAVGRERVEEPGLGRGVRLHGAVVVEVVAREVREDGDAEGERGDALLVECVAGDLHGSGGAAVLEHQGEGAADLGGGGGGQLGRGEAGAVVELDGSVGAGALPGRVSAAVDEVAMVLLPLVPVIPARASRAEGSA